MEQQQQILILARAIEATFSTSNWTEVGYLTQTHEYIDQHPRLLRSLRWGDDDYKGHVLKAVSYMLSADRTNLKRLVEYGPVVNWLTDNDRISLHLLQSDLYGLAVPAIVPTCSEAALKAFADAQALIESRGPSSAVDRVHTGLHGYLKGACSDAGLMPGPDANANQLLKLLLESHPSLQAMGPRGEDVRRLIRTGASILDTVGTLRNRASLAHPNEDLLDHDEALLAINLAHTLLRFLDAKLRCARPSVATNPWS